MFIAERNDLEKQISAGFVNGQIAEFVQNKQRRFDVFSEFQLEPAGILGRHQRVDDIDGAGEEHRVALEAGGIAQRRGEVGFALLMTMPSWG